MAEAQVPQQCITDSKIDIELSNKLSEAITDYDLIPLVTDGVYHMWNVNEPIF